MEPIYHYYFKNQFRPLASLSLHETAHFSCPNSYVLPLERPDAYGVYLVRDGKGVYTLAGTKFPVKKNDVFALYPNIPVRCAADRSKPWELQALSFDGADARLLLNAAGFMPQNPVRTLDLPTAASFVKMLEGIYSWRGQDIYHTITSTAALYAVLSLLAKTASPDPTAVPQGWTGAVHFQKALKFINDSYMRPINVTDIAEHVNLSRSRLYRVFMQQVFISPQQYLTEYRIREAIRLLQSRAGSVKEISDAVGFEDPAYFTRLFKKVTGKSPKNYMKGLIEEKRNAVVHSTGGRYNT